MRPNRINQILFQGILVFSVLIFCFGRWVNHWKNWYIHIATIVVATFLFNSCWNLSFKDLFNFKYEWTQRVQEVETRIKPHSIVLGRVASTLLRDSNHDIGLTYAIIDPNYFIKRVNRILDEFPSRDLYWLVGTEEKVSNKYPMLFEKENIVLKELGKFSFPSDQVSLKSQYIYIFKLSRKEP